MNFLNLFHSSHFRRHFFCIFILFFLWGLLHVSTVSWGLPNYRSSAKDTLPLNNFNFLSKTPKDLMKDDIYKYPPLQYLIWEMFIQPEKNKNILNLEKRMELFSNHLKQYRKIVSLMGGGIVLMIYFSSTQIFRLNYSSLLPCILFLFHPKSIYYSSTTNMDQPFVFWFCFALIVFYFSNLKYGERKNIFYIGNFLFGILLACSFNTKEPVYGLVILPLLAYLSWFSIKLKRIKKSVISLLLWIFGFSLSTVLIYHRSGGKEVFLHHYERVMNYAGRNLSQFENNFGGHFELARVEINDFFTLLDYPLIIFLCMASLGTIFFKNDKKNIILLVFIFLSFISCCLFYNHYILFTYPRYFYPLIPLLSIWVFSNLENIPKKVLKIYLGITSILMVYLGANAFQTVKILKLDPRIILRDKLQSQYGSSLTEMTIAVNGNEWGRQYRPLKNGKFKESIALRDWSHSSFGYLCENQNSILFDPLSIALLGPNILILNKKPNEKEFMVLEKMGFNRTEIIEQKKNIFPSTFALGAPVFYIFKSQSSFKISFSNFEKLLENWTLPEEIMIFQSCLKKNKNDSQVMLFGKICKPFAEFEWNKYIIFPDVIYLTAVGYYLNKRLDSGEKALNFLIKHNQNPKYVRLAKKLLLDFPPKSKKFKNLIFNL